MSRTGHDRWTIRVWYKSPDHKTFLYSNAPDTCVSMEGSQTEVEDVMRRIRKSSRVAKVDRRIDRGAEWLARTLEEREPKMKEVFRCEWGDCHREFDTDQGLKSHAMWHVRVSGSRAPYQPRHRTPGGTNR